MFAPLYMWIDAFQVKSTKNTLVIYKFKVMLSTIESSHR